MNGTAHGNKKLLVTKILLVKGNTHRNINATQKCYIHVVLLVQEGPYKDFVGKGTVHRNKKLLVKVN